MANKSKTPFGNSAVLETINYLSCFRHSTSEVYVRLMNHGITHIGELVANSAENLRAIERIGPSTIKKIRKALRELDLELPQKPFQPTDCKFVIMEAPVTYKPYVCIDADKSKKQQWLMKAYKITQVVPARVKDFAKHIAINVTADDPKGMVILAQCFNQKGALDKILKAAMVAHFSATAAKRKIDFNDFLDENGGWKTISPTPSSESPPTPRTPSAE